MRDDWSKKLPGRCLRQDDTFHAGKSTAVYVMLDGLLSLPESIPKLDFDP